MSNDRGSASTDTEDHPSDHPKASTIFLSRSKSEIQRSEYLCKAIPGKVLSKFFNSSVMETVEFKSFIYRVAFDYMVSDASLSMNNSVI